MSKINRMRPDTQNSRVALSTSAADSTAHESDEPPVHAHSGVGRKRFCSHPALHTASAMVRQTQRGLTSFLPATQHPPWSVASGAAWRFLRTQRPLRTCLTSQSQTRVAKQLPRFSLARANHCNGLDRHLPSAAFFYSHAQAVTAATRLNRLAVFFACTRKPSQ